MDSVSAYRAAPARNVVKAFGRLLDTIAAQSNELLIAEIEGEPCGFLLMLDQLPDEVTSLPQAFVAYMAVEPERRRQGAGAALLAAAEDEARRRGLPHVALMVTEDNEAARTLYERSGYVTERRLMCKAL